MFKAKIKEYSVVKGMQKTESDLFIYDGYDLLKLERDKISVVRNMKDDTEFTFEPNGLWIRDENDVSRFVDYYQKGYKYSDTQLPINKYWKFLDDSLIGVAKKPENKGLCELNRQNDDIRKLDGRFYLDFALGSKKIILREIPKDIICFNMSFEELWRIKVDKECYTDINKGPQIYKDLIIVNYGEIKELPRGEFELNAYSIEDGSLKWQQILPTSPGNSNLIGDKIYVSVEDRIMVINPEDGNILIDVGHGFESEGYHSLYLFNDFLIAASEASGKIHVFSGENGKLVQEIEIPEKYTIRHTWLPVVHEDNLYQLIVPTDMNLSGASNGLLMLTPDKTQPQKVLVDLPEQPTFEINVIKNKSGENEHTVDVSYPDLDDLILYSVITLKKITLGVDCALNPGDRDSNHNGILRLNIDSKPLSGVTLNQLEVIADKVEYYTNDMGMSAGDKRNQYKVIIELK